MLARRILATGSLVSMLLANGCSAEVAEDPDAEGYSSEEALTGSFAVGTELQTTADLNHRESPSPSADILQVIPEGTIVKSAAAQPRANWYGVTFNGKTGWVSGQFLARPGTGGKPVGTGAAGVLAYSNSGDISLMSTTFGRVDGADAASNIRDAAAGRSAKTSPHGHSGGARVALSPTMLSGMVALRRQFGFKYFVTAIAGARHGAGSFHYAGRAIDVGTVNGAVVSGRTSTTDRFMQACTSLGAIEVLGPSNRSDHQDHIHCAW